MGLGSQFFDQQVDKAAIYGSLCFLNKKPLSIQEVQMDTSSDHQLTQLPFPLKQ